MTVIAWDGKTIATDKQTTCGEKICKRTKLFKLSNGDIIASCGDTDRGIVMKKWYSEGADPDKFPSFQREKEGWVRLIVWTKGKLYEFEQEPFGILVEDKFAAFGTGGDFALGAMLAGATAIEAVKIANKLCASCGLGFSAFSAPRY